jgi:hypothetical protein
MQSSAPNSDALTNICALEAWLDSSLSLMDESIGDTTVRAVVDSIKDYLERATFPKQIISPVLGLIPVPPDLEVYSDTWFTDGYIAVNIFIVDDRWQYNVFVDKLNPETGLREYNTDVQLCHGICS